LDMSSVHSDIAVSRFAAMTLFTMDRGMSASSIGIFRVTTTTTIVAT
jgi:hypothetical protein